jgi:hypothetical protein
MEEYIRASVKDITSTGTVIERLKDYQKDLDLVMREYENKQHTEKDKIRYYRIFSEMIQYARRDIVDSDGKQVMPNRDSVIELVKLLGLYEVIYYDASRNKNEFVDTSLKIIKIGEVYKSSYSPGEFGCTGAVFTIASTSNILIWNDIMGYGCIYSKKRICEEINKLELKYVTPQNFVYFLTLISDFSSVVTQYNIRDDSQVEEYESR